MRYILWSGGWDSTYLLCKRARESDETIQPVYVSYHHGNEVNERKRRLTLLDMIRAKADIAAVINPPIEISKEALPPSEEFDAAYERCRETIEGMYGKNMFSFLGRIALVFSEPEIAIEAPAPGTREKGKIEELMTEGGLQIDDDGHVTPGVGDPDILKIFGCFRYPVLRVNAAQMLEDVKTWGYFVDVFHNTWSCYSGLERQCGVCNACEVKWRYGDTFLWRFDARAQKDHAIKRHLQQIDAEKGTKYADYFTRYVMNGDWVTADIETAQPLSARTSDAYKLTQQKSEKLMQYFSYLENNWPEAKDINAPII